MDILGKNLSKNVMYFVNIYSELFEALEVGGFHSEKQGLFKGQFTDMHVWNYALERPILEKIGSCMKTDAYGGAFLSWEKQDRKWDLTNNESSFNASQNIQRSMLCKTLTGSFVGFPNARPFKELMQHCSSFGGRVPMPET